MHDTLYAPHSHRHPCDFVIAGAGIVGLTIARELLASGIRNLTIVEADSWLGRQASGRNSGVLHAGIYYKAGSLKARMCQKGNRLLREWMTEQQLPFLNCGKIIVARLGEEKALISLYENALKNDVGVARWSTEDLQRAAPDIRSSGSALWSPSTSVFDPMSVLRRLRTDLLAAGVHFMPGSMVTGFDATQKQATIHTQKQLSVLPCAHLINAAGMGADKLAHATGVGRQYTMLPFRGTYRQLAPDLCRRVPFCVYPVPDPNLPFLGVHLTPTVDGRVLAGPNAFPALGRQNYHGLSGISLSDSLHAGMALSRLLLVENKGMRQHIPIELQRSFGSRLIRELQEMMPIARKQDLLPGHQPGLRAQLYDKKNGCLVDDFVIENGKNSTHVLNAVSPAFTSSFAFAQYVVRRYNL